MLNELAADGLKTCTCQQILKKKNVWTKLLTLIRRTTRRILLLLLFLYANIVYHRGTTATRHCPFKSIAQSHIVEVLIYLLGAGTKVLWLCHHLLLLEVRTQHKCCSYCLARGSLPIWPIRARNFWPLLLVAAGQAGCRSMRPTNQRSNAIAIPKPQFYIIIIIIVLVVVVVVVR